MKIRKNGKVVRLTESDLQRIVRRVLSESQTERYDIELIKEIQNYIINDLGGKQRRESQAGESLGDRKVTINLPSRSASQIRVKQGQADVRPTFIFDFNEETIYLTDGSYGSDTAKGKPMANPSDNTPSGTRIDMYELSSLNDFKTWSKKELGKMS